MHKRGMYVDWYVLMALAYENHIGGLINRMIDLRAMREDPFEDRELIGRIADQGWNEFTISLTELGIGFDDIDSKDDL